MVKKKKKKVEDTWDFSTDPKQSKPITIPLSKIKLNKKNAAKLRKTPSIIAFSNVPETAK